MIGFKHTKRTRQIIAILLRHGLGWLVVRLGLGALMPFHRGLLGHPRREERYSAPEHLRMAFEELGTTFIKLAQILSTRPDLVSPPYAEEFARLQDRVPALPFETMKEVLEQEWKISYNKVLLQLETDPVASASIGQVYRAQLSNGERVVVKIQKPQVDWQIEEDLAILREAVQLIVRHTEFGRYDLEGLLDEFAFTLRNELDYIQEGQNADRFRILFKDDPRLYIPSIFWEHSTSRVLVMEEIQGIKVNELHRGNLPDSVDRQAMAIAAVEITFREIFEHGFFHGDPHPGNFVIMPGNKLGLMDFGLMGYISEKEKEAFFRFSYALAAGQVEDMIDALGELGISGNYATRSVLKRDLNRLFLNFRTKSLDEIAASDMLREIMRIAFRHQLHFPPDLALLFKVLAMCESLGAMLDPQFKLFDFALPYMQKMGRILFSPEKLIHKMKDDSFDFLQLLHGLPSRLSRLIRRVEIGDIQLTIRQKESERELKNIYGALNRMMIGMLMILFSIFLGAFTLVAHFLEFHSWLLSMFLTAFILAGLASLNILWKIWRSR